MYSAIEVWKHIQENSTGYIGDFDDLNQGGPITLVRKYRYFELKKIPVKETHSGAWTPDRPLVLEEDEEWMQNKYLPLQTTAPAVVVCEDGDGYCIIDGCHRTRAAFLRGQKEILAFVAVGATKIE